MWWCFTISFWCASPNVSNHGLYFSIKGLESFFFAWPHNVLDLADVYFCFANNTKSKLGRCTRVWCAGSHIAATPPPTSTKHLLGVCWGKRQENVEPICQVCPLLFTTWEPNSSLPHMTIRAHFSLTTLHTYQCIPHVLTSEPRIVSLCEDTIPPIWMDTLVKVFLLL